MRLPAARGPLSAALVRALRTAPQERPDLVEARLHTAVPAPDVSSAARGGDVASDLRRLVADDDGPSLSKYLLRWATRGEFREFVQQRSVYHLREADSHTWAIPRVAGAAKAALVEIQSDEYGAGDPARMHAVMYAAMMRALDLDDAYGAWWESARAETFAVVNLMSLFGLHRRYRGGVRDDVDGTNRRYGNGLRRLGWTAPAAVAFYDEHVEADAVHEQLAAVDMCGSFARTEPELVPDVVSGAACALHVEARFAEAILGAWAAGRQDLLGTA